MHVLEEEGLNTGIDLEALVEAAGVATKMVGRSVDSHVGRAGRRFRVLAPVPE